jgi:cell division protein FtsB
MRQVPVLPSGHAASQAWLWARRLTLAAVLAVSLGYLPYRVYLRSGLSRYFTLKEELAQLRAANQRLRQDNRRLLRELSRLRSDELAVERVAREELGLIRPGEIVFRVEGVPGGAK